MFGASPSEMQLKPKAINWFVAISTSLLAFIFSLSFAVGPAVLWPDTSNNKFATLFLVVICIASPAAGPVWLVPRRVQFHVCFWTGLALLVGSLLFVLSMIRIAPTEH